MTSFPCNCSTKDYEKEEGEIDDDEEDCCINHIHTTSSLLNGKHTDTQNNVILEDITSNDDYDDEDKLRWRITQLEDYNRRLGLDAVTISSSSDDDSVVMIKKRRSQIYKKTPAIKVNRKRKRLPSDYRHLQNKNRLKIARVRRKSISPDPITEDYTPHTRLRLRNAIRVSSSIAPDKTSLRNRLNAMLGKKTESEMTELCDEKSNVDNDIEKASEETDDELESLRQMALNSKTLRPVKERELPTEKNQSDDEIDANELRIIALRSAVQKKVQKKGYPKRLKRLKEKPKQTLSQLFSEDMIHQEIEELYQNELDSEFIIENESTNHMNTNATSNIMDFVKPEMIFPPEIINNADSKIIPNYTGNFSFINGQLYFDNFKYINPNSDQPQEELENIKCSNTDIDNHLKDDHLTEDDEEALREQLLSSIKHIENKLPDQPMPVTVERPIISPVDVDKKSDLIIRLGESDSESDCEEIKNLTKMHKKLTDSTGFQDQLEVVLKTIRCNVEKAHITVKQNQENSTKNSLSAVRKLPRAEQKEYLQLVNRMKELERKKLANQTVIKSSIAKLDRLNGKKSLSESSLNSVKSKPLLPEIKGKSQNSLDTSNIGTALDQHMISLSEKIKTQNKIVQQLQNKQNSLNEKTELLKAKLRAVHIELQQSKSAYISNSKILENAKGKLVKMRKQLRILDNRLKSLKSKPVNISPSINTKLLSKENVQPIIFNKKVSVIKKPTEIKLPILNDCKIDLIPCECSAVDSGKSKQGENIILKENENGKLVNSSDYKSPLISSNQSSMNDSFNVDPPDPQSIFCPYEIGGSCKDKDCKYFHPK